MFVGTQYHTYISNDTLNAATELSANYVTFPAAAMLVA